MSAQPGQAGKQAFIDHVPVPLHEQLYLYHNPRVRAIPPPTEFERWVFTGNVWCEVPWDISPLEVLPGDDVVFVRVAGISCLSFGQQLHDYQTSRGHALPRELSLGRTIYNPPCGYRWILVWTEVRCVPDIPRNRANRVRHTGPPSAARLPIQLHAVTQAAQRHPCSDALVRSSSRRPILPRVARGR